jgi:hypothetical protein
MDGKSYVNWMRNEGMKGKLTRFKISFRRGLALARITRFPLSSLSTGMSSGKGPLGNGFGVAFTLFSAIFWSSS